MGFCASACDTFTKKLLVEVKYYCAVTYNSIDILIELQGCFNDPASDKNDYKDRSFLNREAGVSFPHSF